VPLGMTSSTFTQPLPEAWQSRMSKGYTTPSKGAKPFEICNPIPAGSMTTTATDMSRFMLALLNGSTLDDATILRPETLAAMQSRQFELHPELHAMGLVFMEYSQNGHVMWGHGGDTILFHSDMFLLPDARVGLFVSYNSGGARPGSGRGELQRAFLKRYFPPADSATPPKTSDAVAHGREVAGVYEGSRKSETNIFRITSLLGQQAVTTDREGVLTIEDAKNLRGQPKRWQEVAPFVYHEINGVDRVAFRRDEKGKVVDLLPNVPIYLGQRVPAWRSKSLLLPLVGGSLAFMELTVLFWPVAAFVRKRCGRSLLPDSRSRVLFVLSRVACLLWLGMIAAIAIPLARVDEDIAFLGNKIDPWLMTSHIFGWLAAAGVLILILTAIRFWRMSGIGWWTRVHATLLMFAAVTFLCFAWQWHMLSPSLNF
jgi:Beta-lactamase